MYSAELDPQRFGAWRAQAPLALKSSLDAVHRAWGALALDGPGTTTLDDALPAAFMATLGRHAATLSDFMARHPQAGAALQPWLFEVLHFLRVAERFGAHSVVERSPGPPARRGKPRPRLALRCLLPAELLAPRWADAHAATLFSATLAPMAHTQRLLGLPDPVARLDVASPFDPSQWSVRVARGLSTRWADRARTLPRLVNELGAHYRAHPGNHLAFFSSFDYLTQALEAFRAALPDVPVWSQSRSMDEAAREAFIARFAEGGRGMGFAVLGGVFGEGIDLPGSRLVGAFIATLGLPQVNAANEAMRRRMDALFGDGWRYTYLHPGLQKVIQAAGRVIRGPQDRGVVHLIDDRFARQDVCEVLPAWWRLDER